MLTKSMAREPHQSSWKRNEGEHFEMGSRVKIPVKRSRLGAVY